MNRRSCSLRQWLDILVTTALMGASALVGMLALEYLLTGTFGAAKEYFLIAALITCGLAVRQWRSLRPASQPLSRALRTPPQQARH